MNCQQCQRHLLSCERLDSQPPDVAGHLTECQDCRQWQRRLLQIESHVPSLPLPLSQGKEQFVQNFLEDRLILPVRPVRWSRRQRWTLITGVAAAVVLVVCGIALLQALSPPDRQPMARTQPKGPRISDKTLAGKVLELDLRLAEAESPRRRVETLAQLAENLHSESRALARVAEAKDLDALARLYSMVVRDGIIARARSIPAEERRDTLDAIAEQLARTRRDAENLAQDARPGAAKPLLVIAAAAQTGDRQLRDLMKEATP
jgi:hypothetical protein